MHRNSKNNGPYWRSIGLDQLVEMLRPFWPAIDIYYERAQRYPSFREKFHKYCWAKCRSLGMDLSDPLAPFYPDPSSLGSEGIYIGDVQPEIGKFRYSLNELATGMLILGAPQSGKTTSTCSFLEELQREGIGALICDNRGDYFVQAARFPNARVIPTPDLRINPPQPPEGVPLKLWHAVVTAQWTYALGLQDASYIYANRKGNEVLEKCELQGKIPTLFDFYIHIKAQKHRPRSSEEAYQERTLARIEALIQMSGDIFACEKGMPLVEEAEKGRIVIIDMRQAERMLADFLSSFFLYYLYYKRLYAEDAFNQKIVAVVLDEQRSVIRKRIDQSGAISDIDLLFSRARALSISLWVVEQVSSAVGNAILSSSRLRLAFNSNFPEAVQVAQLLGLTTRKTAEELQKLAKGECLGRLSGERIPHPFRLRIPYKGESAPDPEAIDRIVRRSVKEMKEHVVGIEAVGRGPRPSMPSQPPEEASSTEDGGKREQAGEVPLSPDAMLRFRDIVGRPPETVLENTDRTGWERTREQRARKELEKTLGLISHLSVGNKRKIAVLTKQGEELAAKLGWKVRKHKGDPRHDWMVSRTEMRFSQLAEEVEQVTSVKFQHRNFGARFEGRQPDSLVCLTVKTEPEDWKVSEERIVLQVCDRNHADYEATVLGDIGSWNDLRAVVVVTSTSSKRDSIRRKFLSGKGERTPVRMLFLTIEDVMDVNFGLAKELGLIG